MDLEVFWAKHRNFILKVAAGLVVLLLGEYVIGNLSAESERLHTQNLALSNRIVSLRDELYRAGNPEQRVLEMREALVTSGKEDVLEVVLFEYEQWTDPEQADRPNFHYDNMVDSKLLPLTNQALVSNIQLSDKYLGLRRTTPEQVHEELLKMAVAVRTLDTLTTVAKSHPPAWDGKRAQLMAFRPRKLEYHPLAGSDEELLRVVPLDIDIKLGMPAAMELIRELQSETGGKPLQLRRGAVEQAKDGVVRLDLELVALDIVDRSSLPEADRPAERSGRPQRPSRRTGRRR